MLVLVLFDAWMYAWHRLNHRVALLWRFHAVHHTDREMDATDGGTRWRTLPQMLLHPFVPAARRKP